MTALAANFATPPTAEWRRMVPIEVAADKLNLNPDHLARKCRDELQGRGLARFGQHPEGGRAKWWLSPEYDPRLIDGPIGDSWQEPDLTKYTARQREQALQRRACVEAFTSACADGRGSIGSGLSALIESLRAAYPQLHVSRSGLYGWAKLYRRPADLLKLIDFRGGNRIATASAEAWSAFRDLYLHENRPSLRQCHEATARLATENGWRWLGLAACRAQFSQHVTAEEAALHREPALWRQSLSPFIAQDPEAWRAGETSIGDHKQLDIICRFQGTLIRPWLTTWMDWRTRKVTGWALSDCPNSTTILAALRHALKDESNMGGPANIYIDNGKDYDSWNFHGQTKSQRRARIKPAVDEGRARGILNMLQINAHFAIPFNPNGKSRLERFFRTLETFAKTFDTYTGDGPDTKPERLNEILSNEKSIPDFDTVYRRIAEHIAGYNANADHSKDDLSENGRTISPNEAYAAWCDTRRVMADPAALDLLLMFWHRPVSVGRNGVAISIRGQTIHYGQFAPELSRFKGLRRAERELVNVAFDPHDISGVKIYDGQYRYICSAPMNQLGGLHGTDQISLNTVAELNRRKAQYRKALRHTAEHGITSILTTEERLAGLAADKTAARMAAEAIAPPSMRLVATPLDGQAREVQRDELRAAVGAESMSAPRRSIRSPSEIFRNVRPRDRAAEDFNASPLGLRDKLRARYGGTDHGN
jgi:transposase InsO family protein